MNSKQLSKDYFHTYESFFLSNNVVLSTPFVMNRAGDVLNNYSGISIKQQIPLRMYLGYTYTNSWKITISKIHHLDIIENTFIESNAQEYAPYMGDLTNFLNQKYAHSIKEFGGVEIQILTEIPRGVWLGFWSLLALLLATAFKKSEGKIDGKTLQIVKKANINEQIGNTYDTFSSLFTDALELDKHIYGMISSGAKFASFFESYYPIISFSEDYDKTAKESNVKTKRYFGFRLNELYPNLREFAYMPLDYGLIYSGKPVLLEQIAGKNYKNNSMLHDTIKREMRENFSSVLESILPSQTPRFYKYLIKSEEDEFDISNGKLMGSMSLKMLHFMVKMYGNGYDENAMCNFLDILKKTRQADSATRNSSENFLEFIKSMIEHFKWSSKYLWILPNESSIMWGSVIFAMPLEGFRKSLTDTIENVHKEFLGTHLIYANWIDGLWHQGMCIEQDISGGSYSDYLQSKNAVIKRINGRVMIGDPEKLIAQNGEGIMLDMVNNKLYINGHKLTSQDIHSQSATIEILKKLIENPGKDISNKDFPMSSYSKGKNEMLGKIVIPLLEIVEKRTGKKLPLICKGSMYEFYLKLNQSDIDIALIEKL